QAAYDTESAAAMKKDVGSMFVSYSPDFTAILAKGKKVKLLDLRRRTIQAFAKLSGIRDSVSIVGFSLGNDQALTRVKQHSEAVVTDPKTKTVGRLTVDTVLDD